jgi:hypothetical protein
MEDIEMLKQRLPDLCQETWLFKTGIQLTPKGTISFLFFAMSEKNGHSEPVEVAVRGVITQLV